jgi:hypothetical protein
MRRRPIGVWIAAAYLLALLALLVIYLRMFVSFDSLSGSLVCMIVLLIVPSAVILLLCLSPWAVLATAALAAILTGNYLSSLGFDASRVMAPVDTSDTVVFLIEDNLAPLMFLAPTVAVALYTAWLWRRGVLT